MVQHLHDMYFSVQLQHHNIIVTTDISGEHQSYTGSRSHCKDVCGNGTALNAVTSRSPWWKPSYSTT